MARSLIQSQLSDALIYVKALSDVNDLLIDDPEWGGGMHLRLPSVIPLYPDYEGEPPYAWLVGNDFEGYDLVLEEPDDHRDDVRESAKN